MFLDGAPGGIGAEGEIPVQDGRLDASDAVGPPQISVAPLAVVVVDEEGETERDVLLADEGKEVSLGDVDVVGGGVAFAGDLDGALREGDVCLGVVGGDVALEWRSECLVDDSARTGDELDAVVKIALAEGVERELDAVEFPELHVVAPVVMDFVLDVDVEVDALCMVGDGEGGVQAILHGARVAGFVGEVGDGDGRLFRQRVSCAGEMLQGGTGAARVDVIGISVILGECLGGDSLGKIDHSRAKRARVGGAALPVKERGALQCLCQRGVRNELPVLFHGPEHRESAIWGAEKGGELLVLLGTETVVAQRLDLAGEEVDGVAQRKRGFAGFQPGARAEDARNLLDSG